MTVLDPQRRQKYELELNRTLWRAAFYPRQRLQEDLLDLYINEAGALYDHLILPKQFLARLIEIIGEIYAGEFPPELPSIDQSRHLLKLTDPSETYSIFLRTFLRSIVEFTAAFPREARTPLTTAPTPLLTTQLALSHDGNSLTAEAAAAFHALTRPIAEAADQFKAHGIFPGLFSFVPYAWDEFLTPKPRFDAEGFDESEPIYGDQYERREWRERKRRHEQEQRRKKEFFQDSDVFFWQVEKRAYDQQHKEVRANTKEWETAFFYTPYCYYRHELGLHTAFTIPFDIPPLYWFRATWCVAAPDRGKTNLLRHLILHHHPHASVIVLDAKGDLLKSFQRLASIKDRLVIIEPDLAHPPALNPLDMGPNSAEFLAYLFSLLESEMTPNQETLFYMVGLLLNHIPNATIRTFRDILSKGWKSHPEAVEAVKRLDPDEQTFFYEEFDAYKDRRPEILVRLRRLMTNRYLRAMFAAPANRLNLSELMDEGKIVLINNSYNPDRLGEQGAEFFGRLIVAMVWAAARRRAPRPDDKKRPVFFVLDEAHFVIARDRTIKKIINQCRSQKIAMIFAHQEVIDIKDEDAKSALSNCGIKFANSSGEAYELAPRLHTDPEFINQPQGTFACEVVDKPPTVAVTVPHVRTNPDQTLGDYPVLSDYEFHALMLTMRARYCWTPGAQRSAQTGAPEPPSANEGDLHWAITISPRKALKGGKQRLRLTHIGTMVDITVPPNTKHGTVIRLRGRGSFRADGTRGDLYIRLRTEPEDPGKPDAAPGNLRIGHDADDVAEPEPDDDTEAW